LEHKAFHSLAHWHLVKQTLHLTPFTAHPLMSFLNPHQDKHNLLQHQATANHQ
jgi:hypothetical protein